MLTAGKLLCLIVHRLCLSPDNVFIQVTKTAMNLVFPLSPIQQVECSLEEDLSKELIEVTDAGRGIIEKKELQPDDADEINETINALNRQVAELERGTREKKDR